MDICLFGLPKAGKTSIIKVIFQKMGPQNTMMLDSTTRMEIVEANLGPLINFKILDFSGNFDFRDVNPPEASYLENCGAMIFVFDVQSEPYLDAISYFSNAVKYLSKVNPKIRYHIFVHKTDSEIYAVEEKKKEVLQTIKGMVNDDMEMNNLKNTIDFHLTTVYDHTLLECFSKVTQKVIKQVPLIINLLDSLITNCKMEKAFLFEAVTKLYIATDSSPVEIALFSICSEMIDVFIDISCIYGSKSPLLNGDNQSQAVIKLHDNTILYLKEVERYLALICIMKDNNYDRPFLIDYNIDIFKQGLKELFKVSKK